jgi:hypothetical protein
LRRHKNKQIKSEGLQQMSRWNKGDYLKKYVK